MRTRERIRNKCTTEKLRIHGGIVITSLGVGYKKELDHSLEPEVKSKQEKEKHKTWTGTWTLSCPLPETTGSGSEVGEVLTGFSTFLLQLY